jgi:hypothetical protein
MEHTIVGLFLCNLSLFVTRIAVFMCIWRLAFALAFYFCAKKVTAYNNSVTAQAFSGVFFFIMS